MAAVSESWPLPLPVAAVPAVPEVLLDTGARPGGELMDLKWKQVQFAMKPVVTTTGEVDEEGDPIELPNG